MQICSGTSPRIIDGAESINALQNALITQVRDRGCNYCQ
jgi:hypothetical protein